MDYKLIDLLNVPLVHDLMEEMNELFSFPSAIVDSQGKILISVEWQDICATFREVNQECAKECDICRQNLDSHLHEASPTLIYHCRLGFDFNVAPIFINGKHLGHFFSGPFFRNNPDHEYLIKQAKKNGIDEHFYMDAIGGVPVWTKELYDKNIEIINSIIQVITLMGFGNWKNKNNNKTIPPAKQHKNLIHQTEVDTFIQIDGSGNILQVSKAFCQMSGFNEPDLLQMNFRQLSNNEYLTNIILGLRAINIAGQYCFSDQLKHKAGNSYNVEICVKNEPSSIGHLMCFIRKIDDRLNDEYTNLEGYDKFIKIFDKAPVLISITDLETGKYIDVNAYALEFSGFTRDEVIGKTSSEIGWISLENRNLLVKSVLEKGRIDGLELPFKTKNGKVVFGIVNGELVTIENKRCLLTITTDITAHKELYNKFVESNDRYRAFFEQSNDGIVIIDPDSASFLEFNNQVCKQLGYTREEFSKLRIFDIEAVETQEETKKRINRVLLNGREEFYTRQITKLGEKRDIFVSARLINIDGKKIYHCIWRDFTEFKKFENEILLARESAEESNAQITSIIENTDNHIWAIDTQYQITYINRFFQDEFLKVFGQKLEIGDNVVAKLPQPLQPVWLDRYKRVLANESFTLEDRVDNKTLKSIYIQVSFNPIVIGKKVIGATIYARDISESKYHQQELIDAKEKAEENERKFRNAFEHSGIGMALIGLNGKFIQANHAICQMWGYNEIELLDKTFTDVTYFEDKQIGIEEVKKAIAGELDHFNAIKRYVKKDGEYTWANLHVSIIRNSHFEPLFFVAQIQDITRQMINQKELLAAKERAEESQQRFRALFNNLSDSASLYEVIFDKNHRPVDYKFLEVNVAYEKNLQIKATSVIGHTLLEIFPNTEPVWLEKFIEVVETNMPTRIESYSSEVDRYFELIVYIPQKGQLALIGADITNRKVVEKERESMLSKVTAALSEVAHSKDILNEVLERVSDGFVAFDANFNYTYVNSYGGELLGRKASDLIGKNYWTEYPEAKGTPFADAYVKAFETQQPIIFEDYYVHWDRWFVNRIYPSKDGITIFFTDITERKKVEAEIIIAKEKIEESEEKHRFIFENTLYGVVYQDADGQIIYANQAACRILDLTMDEILSRASGDTGWNAIHEDGSVFLGDEHPAMISLRTGQPVSNVKMGLLKSATDKSIWININSIPKFRNNESKPYQVFVIFEDITAMKLATDELIKAKEKAEESDRLKTAFLQNMSHEIRTPMNAIMGFSELLPSATHNPEKLTKFSDIINQRCSDLLNIINDILDISKIESGQLTIAKEEVIVNKLFADLKTFFKSYQIRLKKQHIDFEVLDIDSDNPLILKTDAVKLRQIFINLISNAFKFTEKGKIEVGYRLESNKQVVFYVKDSGIGIPTDKHQFIFERFSQIEKGDSRLYGGTGLGLPIVKGLVELLGGNVWLESETGVGSTFFFTINCKYKVGKLNDETQSRPNQPKMVASNKLVLIVEDDPYNVALMREILAFDNIKIDCATKGNQAIEMALNLRPDLILLDIGLPDISGYEVAKCILSEMPDAKIVAQTAYAAPDDRKNAIEIGCIDYVSKPIKASDLIEIANKYLTP